jgi:general secretion pathway protein H
MWATGKRPICSRGFTLLELLVVLAIISLIAGLFPLALGKGMAGRRTDATARQLADALKDAASRSAVTGRVVRVQIEGGQMVAGTGMRSLRWDSRVTVVAYGLNGAPLSQMEFFPDGSSTAGRIEVGERQHQFVVDVDAVTGRIHVRKGVS